MMTVALVGTLVVIDIALSIVSVLLYRDNQYNKAQMRKWQDKALKDTLWPLWVHETSTREFTLYEQD